MSTWADIGTTEKEWKYHHVQVERPEFPLNHAFYRSKKKKNLRPELLSASVDQFLIEPVQTSTLRFDLLKVPFHLFSPFSLMRESSISVNQLCTARDFFKRSHLFTYVLLQYMFVSTPTDVILKDRRDKLT